MEKLYLEGSAKTPTIDFNFETGVLELKGRSIPENSIEFFKPLNDWIDGYGASPKEKTTIEVRFEYFHTSSSKCILDLFTKLEGVKW